MIRRTIEEHLDKELRLRPQGIKVLSLFFIDVVEHYRSYTTDGAPVKGKYAVMFEEEYRKAATKPKYHTLFKDVDVESDATEVHGGYFSIDKKGTWTDTAENNQGNRDNAERAYNLIMKDKERLLSFETSCNSSSPTPLCARDGTTRTCSRFALCARWAPSASVDRQSAAACVFASTNRATASEVSTPTRLP